jgi:hypothetical protein
VLAPPGWGAFLEKVLLANAVLGGGIVNAELTKTYRRSKNV